MQSNHPTHGSFRRLRRRGSAYVLVMCISLVVTVLGMGALMASRVSNRAVAAGNDWEEAGTLAFSAAEDAISTLSAAAAASPTGWRGSYSNKTIAFSNAIGRGTMKWELVDESDANLANDYATPIRIYGIGTVGGVTRVYSVQVIPGGTPLDVLRTAVHANANITLGGTSTAGNGPFSSNADIKLSGTVSGSVEANSKSGGATPSGSVTVPAPAKTMPLSTISSYYGGLATPITWASLGGGDVKTSLGLLSASSNAFGATDANGLYSITVPSGNKFEIDASRICGTLVISATSSKITLKGPILWEPARPDYPILIISGSNNDIQIQGSNTWLSESSVGMNLNPASTPYQGTSDTNSTDDFPQQFRGVIHIIGSTNTLALSNNSYFVGTVITDCTISTNNQTTLIQDPTIYARPPIGYAIGDRLVPVAGTWKWDTLP